MSGRDWKLFAGRVAFIDLTSRRVEVEELDRKMIELYLGGQGINTRLAYELTPPGADALGPDNVVVVGGGAFVGSMVPGSTRVLISCKSPLNNQYSTSTSGTFIDQMKMAGFDHLVITGQSDRPVFLAIIHGQVTIEDAADLWGLDTIQTAEALWIKYPQSSVLAIGPGGERLHPKANMIGNAFHAAGIGGQGAAFGSKKVKALVALGDKGIEVADPARFMGLTNQVIRETMSGQYTMWWRELGTLIQFQPFAGDSGPSRAATQGHDMTRWTEEYRKHHRAVTCTACPVACKGELEITDGRHAEEAGGPRYVNFSCPSATISDPFLGKRYSGIALEHWDEAAMLGEYCNRLGISTPRGEFEWVMDMHEKGVITKQDLGGMELRRGDWVGIKKFLRDYAYCENFGGLMAQDFDKIKQTFSDRSEMQHHKSYKGYVIGTEDAVKQYSLEGNWHSKRWHPTTFGVLVDPKGPSPGTAYHGPTYTSGRSAASLIRYGRRIGIPEEELSTVFTGEVDGYDTARLTHAIEAFQLIVYALGGCQRPPILRALPIDRLAELYTAGSGIETDRQALLTAAERIITTQRLYNIREAGLSLERDMLPPGYLSPEDEEEEHRLLSDYYMVHGWDPETGYPKQENLRRLNVTPVGAPPGTL